MFFNFSEMPSFGSKEFEAFTMSSASAVREMQTICGETTNYMSKSIEKSLKHFEKLAEIKKPEEAIKLQTEFVKSCFEDFVTESTKIGNLYLKAMKSACPAFQEKPAPTAPAAHGGKKAAAPLID